jgi:hypothetical protein
MIAHTTTVLVVFMLIIYAFNNCRSKQLYFRRAALLDPAKSAWSKLLASNEDGAFTLMTGFNFRAFYSLCDALYSNMDVERERNRTGRPALMSLIDKVGLYLVYVGSTMTQTEIGIIFGILQPTVSTVIGEMVARVCSKLKRHPKSRIRFPDFQQMTHYAALVKGRDRHIEDVIGFLDGCHFRIKCSVEENPTYYSYHGDTTINNVFLFSPEGTVIYASINYPGSWHDSTIASSLMNIVQTNLFHFKIVVDQGFKRSGQMLHKFVGPLSKRSRDLLLPAARDAAIRLSNRYVSLRQAAEWGMRSLQGTFTRLKTRLPENKLKRRQLVSSILLLHNFRTNIVGIGQIRAVFDPEYERCVSIDGYDRLRNYFA